MNVLNKTYAWRRNFDLEERPVDRNDPEAAATAVALAFPHELSDNAWRMLNYLEMLGQRQGAKPLCLMHP